MAQLNFTEEQAQMLLETFKSTKTVAEVAGVPNTALDELYAFGSRLYAAGNYKDAVTVFAPLCVYNQKEYRYWMALGGSLQALGDYQKALDAYQFAALASDVKNVEPLYYGAKCLIAENRPAAASEVINVILAIANPKDAQQQEYKEKAEALFELLKKNAEK